MGQTMEQLNEIARDLWVASGGKEEDYGKDSPLREKYIKMAEYVLGLVYDLQKEKHELNQAVLRTIRTLQEQIK